MKKSLRFASAALAVALAASCAAPAFAAGGSSFTKSETVYAVMNADGSIQSTTVSEHVYSASGLSKVTDQSTLTDIQNTESRRRVHPGRGRAGVEHRRHRCVLQR